MLLTSWDVDGPLSTRTLAAVGLASNHLIRPQGGPAMGLDDKVANAAEHAKGTAKEAAGKVTDNERLEAEGQLDQAKADVKKVGEDVKDLLKE
jgi:uncharacterized protein YjbJ (UPF0337 family)